MARRRGNQIRDNVDLRAPEHAWWAKRPTDPFVRPDPDFEFEDEPGPDPYQVLRVATHATWEDIVASYRRLVRWWHPDGLVDATDADREACELRIRELNEAYQQLRVRRGR